MPLVFILGIPALLAIFAARKKTAAPASATVAAAAQGTMPGGTGAVHVSTETAPLFSTPAMETLYQNANYARAQFAPAQPRGIPIQPRAPVRPAPARRALPRMGLPPVVVENPRLIAPGRQPIAMVGTGGRFRASIL